jgi:hypothetical protein
MVNPYGKIRSIFPLISASGGAFVQTSCPSDVFAKGKDPPSPAVKEKTGVIE